MLKNTDIIIFSGIDWNMQWQWQQELAVRLSKSNRVLFIENTGVRSFKIEDTKRVINRVKNFFKSSYGFREINKNLAVYSPVFLPFPYLKFMINFNSFIISSFLSSWFQHSRFNCKIIFSFISTPLTIKLINKIPHDNKVFIYTDNMPKASNSSNELEKYVKTFSSTSDITFYSADNLKKQLANHNKKLFYFPGGVDLSKFDYGKYKNIKKKKIIGYVGQIKNIIDKNLLKEIAKKFPNNKIQLIGPIATQINDLKKIKNIEILGQVPHSKIPKLLSTFKVALIPYIKNSYTDSISPAKLSEYLSMGIPCVSTNLQEISNFNKKNKNLIFVAKSTKDFLIKIDLILKMKQKKLNLLTKNSINQAKLNDWRLLFDRFVNICERNLFVKNKKGLSNWRKGFELGYIQLKSFSLKLSFFLFSFYVLVFGTPLISLLSSNLTIFDNVNKSNTVLVSSGSGSTYLLNTEFQLRYKETLNIYRAGYAENIIIMRREHNGIEEGELIKKLLISSGVNEKSITVVDKEFNNSFENYRYIIEKYLKDEESFILVVAPHLSLRAKMIIEKNSNLNIMVAKSLNEEKYKKFRINLTLKETKTIIREYLAIAHNRLSGRL